MRETCLSHSWLRQNLRECVATVRAVVAVVTSTIAVKRKAFFKISSRPSLPALVTTKPTGWLWSVFRLFGSSGVSMSRIERKPSTLPSPNKSPLQWSQRLAVRSWLVPTCLHHAYQHVLAVEWFGMGCFEFNMPLPRRRLSSDYWCLIHQTS